jgi:hypothetical protein
MSSNDVHLLVKEAGGDVIAQSIRLIAGRTAQEYKRRKNRHGAFWEDRLSKPMIICIGALCISIWTRCAPGVVSIRANRNTAGIARFTSRLAAIPYVCCPLPVSIESSGLLKFDLQGLMHEPSKNLLIF